MIDDMRRKMPKLKCPYCRKRVADLATKELKNFSTLERYEDIEKGYHDIILECPHCHRLVSLQIKRIGDLISNGCSA